MWPQEDGSAVLKVVCAGHPLPLRLRQDGTVEPAAEPQPLLGVMEDLELYEQTVTLDPGDVLLCVTDGVTERREGTRMLGDDGLADVLTTCTGLTAGAVAARILRAVERFAADAALGRHGDPRDARPGALPKLTDAEPDSTDMRKAPADGRGPSASEPQNGIEP